MTTYTLAINGEQMGNQQVLCVRCNLVSERRSLGLLTFRRLNGSVKLFYQVNLFGAAPLFIYFQGFQRISRDRLANLT